VATNNSGVSPAFPAVWELPEKTSDAGMKTSDARISYLPRADTILLESRLAGAGGKTLISVHFPGPVT
jgi:hypothetical protein